MVSLTKERRADCEKCGKEFARVNYKQRFCSKTCYKAAHYIYRLGWLKNRPKDDKERYRFADRCRRRGTTPEAYKKFWDEQAGLCAICRKRPIEHIDHSHRTDKVRGLLCGLCNRGLGQFRDDVDTLLAAAAYLERTERE